MTLESASSQMSACGNTTGLTDWVKVLRTIRHRTGNLRDVLPSQSLGLVLKKLYPTQQKQATQEYNTKNRKNTKLNKHTKTKSKPKPTCKFKNCSHVCVCVCMTVHNCRTQYNTEQFWLFSLLTSRQSSQLSCCLLEGRGKYPRSFLGNRTNHENTGQLNRGWDRCCWYWW